MSYAWIIDKDHLAEELEDEPSVGVVGPSDAPDRLEAFLRDRDWEEGDGVEVFVFEMRDGDGIPYYTGRLITDEGKTEAACYGPLRDYGGPNAGCAVVTYPGHPEMDVG